MGTSGSHQPQTSHRPAERCGGELGAACDPGRRRARRPLPAGRPPEREWGRPVLARARPHSRAARRTPRDRGRRPACGAAPRRGPPFRDGPRPAHPAGARRRADRRQLLRGQRVGVRHLARHHAGEQRAALAAAWGVDGQRGGRLDRGRARARRRPRAALARERAARQRRLGPDHRVLRRRGAARPAARRPAARRGRPGRAAARDPDRSLGGGLAVRRAPCAREARPGAPAPAGAGRRAQRPGRPVRRAAQPARPEDPRRRQRPRHPELPGRLRRRPDRAGLGDRGRQPGEERDGRAARRTRDPGQAAPGRLGPAARARGARARARARAGAGAGGRGAHPGRPADLRRRERRRLLAAGSRRTGAAAPAVRGAAGAAAVRRGGPQASLRAPGCRAGGGTR